MSAGTQNKSGKNWNWKGGDLTRKLHVGMMKNMERACNKGKNMVVQSFGSGAGGGRAGRVGTPSQPGQPPNVQTGHLRRNINYEVKSLGELKISGRIGTGIGNAESVGYAVHLEYGTRPHTIIAHGDALMFMGRDGLTFRESVNHPGFAPRPFLRPLFQNQAKRKALEKALGSKII